MDKGCALTLNNSSANSLCFFPSKQPTNAASTLSISKLGHETMFPPPGLGFPVNLTRRDDHLPSDDDRVVDFFSERNKPSSTPPDHDHHHRRVKTAISTGISIKKESSHPEPPHNSSLDVNTGLQLLTANTKSDQSTLDDGVSSDTENKRVKNVELAELQNELQRINTENQKLKEMLSHVSSNYTALQMHLVTLMQQNQSNDNKEQEVVEVKSEEKNHGTVVPRQFLDIRPAEVDDQTSNSSSEERTRSSTPAQNNNSNSKYEITREESPDSETQAWGPSKVQKLNPSTNMDQSSPEATMRKARVSVRARSEAPMISDGCQWRKYGQKMAKGNPCPRAYYRCTMAVGCPVRKQVQRCAEDRTILITTYEGAHNHPLPPAAMAMANTTTAAATMLLSGSMSSADGLMNPNLLARAILPYSTSMATLSASAPFPTVTLDLTHNPNPLQFQRPQTPFRVPFGSGSPTPATTAGQLPQVFAQALYNQSKFSGLQLSQDMASSQLPNQAPRPTLQPNQHQPSLADTVSAATAAITADPNFTAVLAAAISSIISGAHPNNNNDNSNINPNITNSNTISRGN